MEAILLFGGEYLFLLENICFCGKIFPKYYFLAGGGGGEYPFHTSLSRQSSQEKNAVQGSLLHIF